MSNWICIALLSAALLFADTVVGQDVSSRMAPDADPDGVIGSNRSRDFGNDREAPGLGMLLIQRIDAVNYMIDQNAFNSALAELRELENRPRLTPFEETVIAEMIGFVYGQMREYELAIEYYRKALDSGEMPTPMHQGALYSLAHLHASKQEYVTAIELMIDWFQFEPEAFAEAYMFTGNNYAALAQYEDALPWMERAIERSVRPIESWYQVTYSVYLELKRYDDAITMLKFMIEYWPRMPEYWEALAGIYQETGDDRAAFDTLMTAYINGMVLTVQSVLTLVDMSLVHETPYVAGSIFENEMIAGVIPEDAASLEALIDIWISAREYDRAIAAIEKMTAYADAGPYYMRAARLYVQSGDFAGAAASAEKAIETGVDDRVQALVIAGTAYSETGEFDKAIEAFRQILAEGDEDERTNAANWIGFIEESRQLTASSLP